jgi:hypothetical protein
MYNSRNCLVEGKKAKEKHGAVMDIKRSVFKTEFGLCNLLSVLLITKF